MRLCTINKFLRYFGLVLVVVTTDRKGIPVSDWPEDDAEGWIEFRIERFNSWLKRFAS